MRGTGEHWNSRVESRLLGEPGQLSQLTRKPPRDNSWRLNIESDKADVMMAGGPKGAGYAPDISTLDGGHTHPKPP